MCSIGIKIPKLNEGILLLLGSKDLGFMYLES